jgi:predicted metal-dependent RNase
MASIRTRIFSPSELQVIELAYEAAWAEIVARNPTRDTSKDEKLRSRLRKRIFVSADRDISDVDEVRDKLVRSLPEHWIEDA